MLFKNIEIHNVAKLYDAERGGTTWLRVPDEVFSALEHGNQARNMAKCCTGVELRFVIKSGEGVTIRMAQLDPCGHEQRFPRFPRRNSGQLVRLRTQLHRSRRAHRLFHKKTGRFAVS